MALMHIEPLICTQTPLMNFSKRSKPPTPHGETTSGDGQRFAVGQARWGNLYNAK